MTTDDRILKIPAPAVVSTAFNQRSVDFELFYLVTHMPVAPSMKSEFISRIDATFKKIRHRYSNPATGTAYQEY